MKAAGHPVASSSPGVPKFGAGRHPSAARYQQPTTNNHQNRVRSPTVSAAWVGNPLVTPPL